MPFAEIAGARLFHDEREGGGPCVVLIHGGMCDHRDWRRLIPALPPDWRVVSPDLRAHGRSGGEAAECSIERWAADINALVAALGLAPAVLVGHSLASRIVAEAAWQMRASVAGIVLLDGSRTHGGLSATVPPVGQSSEPMQASLSRIIDATIGAFADADARAQVHETMGSAPPDVMAACVTAMRDWDIARADMAFAALAGTLPVLAIQSTYHDRHTPRHSLTTHDITTPYLDFLRSNLPQIQVRVLPGAGHFSMLERPGDIAAMLTELVGSLTLRRPR